MSSPRTPASVDARFQAALVLHQSGQIADAQARYLDILKEFPDHFDSLHLLGVTALQTGQPDVAEPLLRQAIALNPGVAAAHNHLGAVLQALQQPDEALVCYERALALDPACLDACFNGGNVLVELGRLDEALARYDRLLKQAPQHAASWGNRGGVLAMLQRHEEALASYDRAVGLDPSNAEAFHNRGIVLASLGRARDALASYDRALALDPGYVDAYLNRGNLLAALGQPEAALASYEHAIRCRPDNPDALSNRGCVLKMLGRLEDAVVSCEQALTFNPGHVGALNNLGNALLGLWRLDDALACYERAIKQSPDDADGYSNRGNALLAARQLEAALLSYDAALALNPNLVEAWNNRGNALVGLQRFEEAAASFGRALDLNPDIPFLFGTWLHTRMKVCDWQGLTEDLARYEADIAAGKPVAAPFASLGLIDRPDLHRKAAEMFAAVRHPAVADGVLMGADRRPAKNGKIRIGYYSADFHNHATAYLMAELFEAHDAARFELVGFSFGPDKNDEMRQRLVGAFDNFIDVRNHSDREVAALSRELGIDIAVDLKGYTQDCRPGIFAAGCAPIQVSYLGYPGTMGVPYIHYVIADRTVIPPDHQGDYSEAVVYLPDTYQVNDSTRRISERTITREECGLPAEGFVFCCFNNNYKILPASFDGWMRILGAVEGSVLWLLEDNAIAAANLRREAEARGIAGERLVFAQRMALDEHLARHRLADLFLDTLPYNAHTTASDALWAGLPVLTCLGKSFASRVAASLLRAIGLPELIVETADAYEATAIALAGDRARLDALRARLEENRRSFPLFDGRLFAKNLEAAYAAMFARWQAGLAPSFIEV
jgi:protein O-GlcNAc transferase